jgi:multiple sugar transport system permease protein
MRTHLPMTAIADKVNDDPPRLGWAEWLDRRSGRIMVMPAVIVLLCFAIFPLIISAYLSLSRFALAPGGFKLRFIGLANFRKLLSGSQQYHLLGTFGAMGAIRWILLAAVAVGLLVRLAR